VANATRSCAPPCYIGGESTRVARSCEGLDRRCPPSLWSPLEAVGTACRLPPAQIRKRPTHPQWRLRAPGQIQDLWGCSPLLVEFRHG